MLGASADVPGRLTTVLIANVGVLAIDQAEGQLGTLFTGLAPHGGSRARPVDFAGRAYECATA